ncbi:MAG: hypothetical protein SPF88_01915 [Schaalia hyovaginalis]|uniref:hypothetical protein n=1 Tax=Schaalia hyovaginalis TaxID=29316 RepID=UPI002A91AFDD|nr:hypothetical protein [Schaalia hyovaginalis]MDY5600537.1 hypothetical protein [Schaalia hyovaginalis]
MTEYDMKGPDTRTRRYWVSATVGIGAMLVFALLSLFLLGGVMFGSGSFRQVADRAFPWSLLALFVAGVAMLIANRRGQETDEERALEGVAEEEAAAEGPEHS